MEHLGAEAGALHGSAVAALPLAGFTAGRRPGGVQDVAVSQTDEVMARVPAGSVRVGACRAFVCGGKLGDGNQGRGLVPAGEQLADVRQLLVIKGRGACRTGGARVLQNSPSKQDRRGP